MTSDSTHLSSLMGPTLGIALLVSSPFPIFASDTAPSEGSRTTSGAHGLRSPKDLPKPLPKVVEAVNTAAREAGKGISKVGQEVKDAANKGYKKITKRNEK